MDEGRRGDGRREPVFVRVGGRYAYNLRNPVGLGLAVGSLVAGAVVLVALARPGVFTGKDRWDADELREAVTAAGPLLERSAAAGPGISDPEGALRSIVERHGDKYGGTVSLDGVGQGDPDTFKGSYTVTADGTDAEFCVTVTGTGADGTSYYEWLDVTTAEGACGRH